MSLRLRLTLTLGSAFVLLWALAATWMLFALLRRRGWSRVCWCNCRNRNWAKAPV